MKILIVHPEDSPRCGPWTQQKWDLLVDLGRSSEAAALEWEDQLGCPVLRLDSFRGGASDLALVQQILSTGQGRLLDSAGLDWWELTGLLIQAELEYSILLRRIAPEFSGEPDVYASRSGWPVDALASILKRDVRSLREGASTHAAMRVQHYRRVLRNMSFPQLSEIALDKYDAAYKWRRVIAARSSAASRPVVLVPTAYTNVSRMAGAYARMLPDQQFLFVTTRRSARQFEPCANVRLANLASYAQESDSRQELASLVGKWEVLLTILRDIPEMQILYRLNRLNRFATLFRDGLAVRDLWRGVLEREPVTTVLCGDDSNRYTRIPVILARNRGLPTIDFHHGALDGRCLLKTLASDLYFAKSEMERDYLIRVCGIPVQKVVLGGPERESVRTARVDSKAPTQIVLFSEPYESAGARADEIYRQLVPPLARLARQSGIHLLIKLHPFESFREREGLVNTILRGHDRGVTQIVDGPLSDSMLLETWFGVTVESSAVLDCASQGVPCFLCHWLALSSYGYLQQYARFGIGLTLHSPGQIPSIPLILANRGNSSAHQKDIWRPIEPNVLRRCLAGIGRMVDSGEEPRKAIAAT